jgi:hypothetical protein
MSVARGASDISLSSRRPGALLVPIAVELLGELRDHDDPLGELIADDLTFDFHGRAARGPATAAMVLRRVGRHHPWMRIGGSGGAADGAGLKPCGLRA